MSLGLLCLALLWHAPVPAHAAEEGRVFDPTLSLTGRCTTEALDEVPDPWCPGPPGPSKPFESPNVVIDYFGNIYVGSYGKEGTDGRVDVFSPGGEFITSFAVVGPRDLAIDTEGNLYVLEYPFSGTVLQISRFSPTTYAPEAGEIAYEDSGVVAVQQNTPEVGHLPAWAGLAVNPTTDRVLVGYSGYVAEFGSEEEGNALLDPDIGKGTLSNLSKYLAVDVERNRLYVSDSGVGSDASFIQVFELEAPHDHLGVIDGGATPGGKFLSDAGYLTVDADEATGHVFVSDLDGSNKVFELGPGLDEAETYVAKYERKFKGLFPGEVAIDNAPTSPNRGTLFVPSGGTVDHVYAFRFFVKEPPEVESVSFSNVTETEAVLRAVVNPKGSATEYRFEYLTQQAYEDAGESFAGAAVAKEGTLPAGVSGVKVSAPISGLEPGTAHRFRVVAINEGEEEDEAQAPFATYPAAPGSLTCPNEALRTGLSALLPDCRAYELVSPADTNGRAPLGSGNVGPYFPTLQASADGERATFRIEGGSLPGTEASGAFSGDNYLATRTASGWSTEAAAPSGTDYFAPLPGGTSPDQLFSFWGGQIEDEPSRHLRRPDGSSELVGRGSLGEDHNVEANLISSGGAHVIFTTRNVLAHKATQLEPNAPPEGTTAVYDRNAATGQTHVVSLLPGDLTPGEGQNASYAGASYDGQGIAFEIGSTLYLRHRGEETFAIGTGLTFSGLAEGGGRIFYLEGGNLEAFDVGSGEETAFTTSGDATPVNVSADGSSAYFLSPSVLGGVNPRGEVAQPGEENLYLSREGAVSFVGTVTERDVADKLPNGLALGLGEWIAAQKSGQPGRASSRTTPAGEVLLFESEAAFGDYDPQGKKQIYRYDFAQNSLECLSCNPTGAPSGEDARLQTIGIEASTEAPVSASARMPNLSSGGRRAFFESSEQLVPGDTDGGRQDVYEWEANGVGSCTLPEGCLYLISSGRSARDNFFFSASEDGGDVFFLTADRLLGADSDATPSLYDARVNGGFAAPPPVGCEGEGCRPQVTLPPALAVPALPALGSKDNVVKPRKCPKGKRKVKRSGKVRCVKKKSRKRRASHRRAGAQRKEARR